MLNSVELESVLAAVGRDGPAGAYEGQHLDFKEDAGPLKKVLEMVADAAVCFANSAGGTIVLGVRDKSADRTDALGGVRTELTVDVMRKAIFDRTQPSITSFVEERELDGVRLLLVNVPPGVTVHSNAAGLATRRLGSECLPFTPDQQREVLIARGYIDWSAESAGVEVGQLSEVELDRCRRRLRSVGSDELADLRTPALLSALRLIASDGAATNAAVVLLGDEKLLAGVIPNHGYSYQYRPTPGSEAVSRFRRSRGLLAAAEDLLEAVAQRVVVYPLALAGGVQLQLTDYPEIAIREVVVNALVHRAFDAPGSVDVEQSPERLTVTSPGGLVAGVTPANILTHPSTPRHRLLAETVTRLQLAERTGQGIDRAYREMLRLGKEPPEFDDSGTLTRATLRGGIGNDTFVRFVSELSDPLSRDVEVLLTLATLRRSSSVSAQQLAPVIQRSPAVAQEVLGRLADESLGILEPTRSTARKAHPSYRLRSGPLAALSRALTYRRRTVDEIDAKVIEHVHEYGFVTNRTLQRLFDVHVYAARDLLNDLRNRGILKKVGDARGGPGVRYIAGPRFPRTSRDQSRTKRETDDLPDPLC